jgi:serine/threonine-protein kinase
VYATGCVVYELLTGHPPFVGDNPVSVAYQHVREDPRPPSASNRDVTPDIDAVVLKALAKNRANRYQSAGEMRSDLLRAAAGRPVMATPVMTDLETAPIATPPPRVVGNRNTGTMARVGNAQRRRASTWVIASLVALGLVALAALGTGLYLANRTQNTTVPNLVGRSRADADTLLSQSKLHGQLSGTVFNATCTKDTVTAQDPQAGKQVSEGGAVNYSLCGGPEQATVPSGLVGLSQSAAADALTKAGLVPSFVQVDGLVDDKGKVIQSDPAPGQQVAKGSTVKVTISKGNQAVVPDVSGLSEDAARQKLKDSGFTNIKSVPNNLPSPDQIGKVTGQTPEPNKTVTTGTQILIVVGVQQAPPTTSTPSASTTPSAGG